jgi:chemotaxis protein methyltransferase CheR
MEPSSVSDSLQLELREFIAERIGLHFPRNRWEDLQRGLVGAMTELGFADLTLGAESLLSASLTKTQLDVVASHLTIGETYFFREKKTFEILAQKVLPELIGRFTSQPTTLCRLLVTHIWRLMIFICVSIRLVESS